MLQFQDDPGIRGTVEDKRGTEAPLPLQMLPADLFCLFAERRRNVEMGKAAHWHSGKNDGVELCVARRKSPAPAPHSKRNGRASGNTHGYVANGLYAIFW